MKKTIIALFALAGVAIGADDLGYSIDPQWKNDITFTGNEGTIKLSEVPANWSSNGSIYWGGTNSIIDLTVDGNFTPWRIVAAKGATISSLTLSFIGASSLSVPSNSETNLSFNQIATLNLNFGSAGIISTGKVITFGSDDVDLNFTTTTDLSKLSTGIYTRDLLVSTDQIWFSDNYLKFDEANHGSVTFSDSNLDAAGYTYKGFIYADKINSLKAGEYALALVGTQKYQLVANIVPEPTTATLSLLALAGLAARRRRK